MTPDAKDLCVFAVKRGDMKNRLDINYNLPQYTMLEEKLSCEYSHIIID